MEAAAAVVKVATTAATEGATVAATIAPAVTEGAVGTAAATMAGAEAATAATEVTGGVKTAEAAVTGAEVITPEAAQAAGKIDTALATGAAAPEEAMLGLAESVTEVTPERAALQEEIQRAVQPQMAEWEKSNPPGNDIQGWIERRAAAERQFTVNEGVSRDLSEWKGEKENSPPDKDKDPEGYTKWEQRLAARERESRQSNEASYEQFLREQEEKRQGMSKQEFMRRYAELLQLRTVADQLAMRLQKLKISSYQTSMRKDVLTRAEAQLDAMRADIATREAELQFDAIGSRSSWKQFIIPALVGAAVVVGPAVAAASEV